MPRPFSFFHILRAFTDKTAAFSDAFLFACNLLTARLFTKPVHLWCISGLFTINKYGICDT